MNTLYLDFETQGPDIKTHGAARHLAGGRINCMAYSINVGPIEVVSYHDCTRDKLVPLLVQLIHSVDRVVAHNAQFEIMVLWFVLGMPVHLPEWVCTMAKAAYHGYPMSLDGAAKALSCTQLKDVQGKDVMKKLATGKYTPETSPGLFDRLHSYCARDILPMREMDLKLPELPLEVKAQWELDAEINLRGIPVDVQAIRNAVALIAELKEKNNAEMAEITGGAVETIGQVERLVKWVNAQPGATYRDTMTDCTADTVDRMLTQRMPDAVRRALQLRQSTGLSSLSKYEKMLDYQIDGRLYGMFIFYGAHTGRPTGTGPQMLNPPRGEDPMRWADLLCYNPELFTVISKPDERLKEALRGIISVA